MGYDNVTLVITDTMLKQVVSVHEHEYGESQFLQNVITFLQNYSVPTRPITLLERSTFRTGDTCISDDKLCISPTCKSIFF